MKEALLWHKENNKIRCDLCGRGCLIPEGQTGFCLVRKNIKGKLFSLNYGKLIATGVDPIEKKPLFHFLPGSYAFSISAAGCNFTCVYCFLPNQRVIINGIPTKFEDIYKNPSNEVRWQNGYVKFPRDMFTLTHKGELTRVKKIYKHLVNEEVVKIKPYYFPAIHSTLSHRFLVFDKKKREIIEIPASKLNRKLHMLLIPKKIKTQKSDKEVLDLAKLLKVNECYYSGIRKFDRKKVEKMLSLRDGGLTSKEIGEIFNTNPAYVRNLFVKYKRGKIREKIPIRLLFNESKVWFPNEKKEKI